MQQVLDPRVMGVTQRRVAREDGARKGAGSREQGAELVALRVLCGAVGSVLAGPQLVLALALLNVGVTVPVSVANLGVYEATLAFGLTRSGVPLAAAVAIATLHHGIQLLGTNLGAGALWLWRARRAR